MPLKSVLFLCFYMLCSTRNKQVNFQPAGLYFMIQFQYVIRHAHKIPFHCDIGVSSGQKSAEVQIFLDCGKHALRLNGTIDPEQDPFGCGNLFLHCFSLLDKIFGNIQTLEAIFRRFFVRHLFQRHRPCFLCGQCLFCICVSFSARDQPVLQTEKAVHCHLHSCSFLHFHIRNRPQLAAPDRCCTVFSETE